MDSRPLATLRSLTALALACGQLCRERCLCLCSRIRPWPDRVLGPLRNREGGEALGCSRIGDNAFSADGARLALRAYTSTHGSELCRSAQVIYLRARSTLLIPKPAGQGRSLIRRSFAHARRPLDFGFSFVFAFLLLFSLPTFSLSTFPAKV